MTEVSVNPAGRHALLTWCLAGTGILLLQGLVVYLVPVSYSAAILPAAGVAAFLVGAWILRPLWALYATLFFLLVPTGILPAELHSLLNRALTAITGAGWLIGVVRSRPLRILRPSAVLMILFLVWASVTLAWADDPGAGILGLQVYATRMLLFLVLVPALVTTREVLDGIMRVLAASGAFVVAVSFAMVLLQGYTPGTRLHILGVNENDLGMAALVAIPGILWLAQKESAAHARLRVAAAAAFLVLTVGLIAMSGSQGTAISLAVMTVSLFVWKPTRRWGKAGAVLALAAVLLFPSAFLTTFERLGETVRGGSLGERSMLWREAWRLIAAQPVAGVGLYNSQYEVGQGLRLPGEKAAPVHNPLLAVWSETGLPGLGLYLGVLAAAVLSFVRQHRYYRAAGADWILLYSGLAGSLTLSFLVSWVKGGGAESSAGYFFILSLLLCPGIPDRDPD